MRDIFLSDKVFQSEIKKNKPCFLIGNGICRYMGAPNWSMMLEKVISAAVDELGNDTEMSDILKLLRSDSVKTEAFNNPEVYTSLLLSGGIRKSRDCIKKRFKDFFEEGKSCRLLEYAKGVKAQILTTNFDYTIERALGFSTCKGVASCSISRAKNNINSETYPFGDYTANSKRDDLYLEAATAPKNSKGPYIADECAVWHIHGFVSHSQTILLGFEDYIAAIMHLKRLQSNSPEAKGHYAEPWDDNFVMKNSWLRLFFTHPLVIVGNSLNSEEIFLRWLLIRRMRQKTLTSKTSIPPIYYLDTEEEAKGKPELDETRRCYFKHLGIRIVRYGDYAELYDGRQWECAPKA